MKRIVLWVLSTLTCLVLLFGYHTSTSGALASSAASSFESSSAPSASSSAGSSSGSGSSGSGSSGSGSSGSGSSGSSGSGSSSAAKSSKTSTVTGSVASTRWGPVQVQLTVSGGKITKVDVLQYPNGNPRDAEINDTALPILIQETVDKQSASIDMVSGATVTSDGYIQSLQSAVDQANL
jgi:uncharacterized protein with FMN-binding domain